VYFDLAHYIFLTRYFCLDRY